jgi:hypothetical protein
MMKYLAELKQRSKKNIGNKISFFMTTMYATEDADIDFYAFCLKIGSYSTWLIRLTDRGFFRQTFQVSFKKLVTIL